MLSGNCDLGCRGRERKVHFHPGRWEGVRLGTVNGHQLPLAGRPLEMHPRVLFSAVTLRATHAALVPGTHLSPGTASLGVLLGPLACAHTLSPTSSTSLAHPQACSLYCRLQCLPFFWAFHHGYHMEHRRTYPSLSRTVQHSVPLASSVTITIYHPNQST